MLFKTSFYPPQILTILGEVPGDVTGCFARKPIQFTSRVTGCNLRNNTCISYSSFYFDVNKTIKHKKYTLHPNDSKRPQIIDRQFRRDSKIQSYFNWDDRHRPVVSITHRRDRKKRPAKWLTRYRKS